MELYPEFENSAGTFQADFEEVHVASQETPNALKYVPQNLTPEQQAQARQNIGAAAATEEIDYAAYFDVNYDGVVSLKPEYRGSPTKDNCPYAISDNGVGVDGSKNAELPEVLIIPDVINGIAVSALVNGMFRANRRVRSITIPQVITTIPEYFADASFNLTELNGTDYIEFIGRAAFQGCGIKKAMFPNLKGFNGAGQFNLAPNLVIADIGNTVTTISQQCFSNCDKLSLVRGGASVTDIGKKSFFCTAHLKNLPFVENVKTIGDEAFVRSRVNFDWWTFKETSGCTFGTNATPAHFNSTDWWSGCTYSACENPLGSTFHQRNPEWADYQIPNSADTYYYGCLEISAAHIYSALTGVKFDTPRYFVEDVVGSIDNGSLLVPTGGTETKRTYSFEDINNWFTALGMQCNPLYSSGGYNADNLQTIYDELADGALVLTHMNPGHACVIYGIAENGEVLLLDSDGTNYRAQDYTAYLRQMPIWSFALKGERAIIVKKKEEK